MRAAHHLVAYLVLSQHATKQQALDALGEGIADGSINERLVYRTGIKRLDGRWYLVIKAGAS